MTILSVNDMVAHINRNYLLKPSLYQVNIFGGDPNTDASPDIMLNCSQVNVPGTNIQFNPVKKHGIGIDHQMPIGRSFTEINLTFYESDGEREREFFTNWQSRIYNPSTKRFGYFKDFVKTITISQYDKRRNKTYECRVLDAYPSNVSPLDKGYANEGIAQFNVNFQFHTIEEVSFEKKQSLSLF